MATRKTRFQMTLSSKETLDLFNKMKHEAGSKLTNDEFLKIVLSIYTPFNKVDSTKSENIHSMDSTYTPISNNVPLHIHSMDSTSSEFTTLTQLQNQIGDFSRAEYDSDMKQILDFDKNVYEQIKKIYSRLSKLETPVTYDYLENSK